MIPVMEPLLGPVITLAWISVGQAIYIIYPGRRSGECVRTTWSARYPTLKTSFVHLPKLIPFIGPRPALFQSKPPPHPTEQQPHQRYLPPEAHSLLTTYPNQHPHLPPLHPLPLRVRVQVQGNKIVPMPRGVHLIVSPRFRLDSSLNLISVHLILLIDPRPRS
jgi:hypothetical protein